MDRTFLNFIKVLKEKYYFIGEFAKPSLTFYRFKNRKINYIKTLLNQFIDNTEKTKEQKMIRELLEDDTSKES